MKQADSALSNPSSNPAFEAVLAARFSRRQMLAAVYSGDVFLLCSDPASSDEAKRGTINGDVFA
jgi:hypothetical protein